MNSFTVFLAFAVVTVAVAEPPSGYNYNRPSSGGFGGSSFGGSAIGGGFSGGHGGGGFGGGGFGGGFSSGGGGYQHESIGFQGNEGAHVDQQLLEEVRQILLREESQAHSSGGGGFGGGHGGFGGGAPSGSYGPPAPVYGPPSVQTRVVGVHLEGVKPAIQVAQLIKSEHGSIGGGYPSGPSSTYGAPSRPSSQYGAPF